MGRICRPLHATFEPALLDAAETLTGFSLHDYRVPIVAGGSGPEGVLIVGGANLSEADSAAVRAFADQATTTIENARLLEAVSKHRSDLRALSTQLLSAQEAGRKRISQELHDEIGQALTAMSVNLDALGAALLPECEPAVAERLADTASLVGRTLAQVREMALDLRPSTLDDLGLLPTLR